MKNKLAFKRIKNGIGLAGLVSLLMFGYTNCGDAKFQNVPDNVQATSVNNLSGQLTISAAKPNPPLDLFFVVDNSASMLGHQINLGAAFANIFKNNKNNLANFDTNIYVFSTASTVNDNYMNLIPNRAPNSITSIPSPNDTANLASVPGAIFGLWTSVTGQYGSAPFNAKFLPSPVLDVGSSQGAVTQSLFIPRKGTQSDSEYQATIDSLTTKFQNRLAFLNPTNQLDYTNLTNVSSGLCSTARILNHATDYVKSGDAAAFVYVTDDDDRLNVRNDNNNNCAESIVASDEVIDGKCGHYESAFNYDTKATVSYQSNSKFTYQSGTKISYSVPTSEDCGIHYNHGYKYTWSYTALKTVVTYTRCDKIADGVCVKQTAKATATINGDYAGNGGSCSQDMAKLVNSPVYNSTFSCVSGNVANVAGAAGVDFDSTGTKCSTQLLTTLSSDATKSNIVCTVGAQNNIATTIAAQGVNSCASYCGAHGSQYPGCTLTSTTLHRTTSSLGLAENGISCSSKCPESNKCGTGTISSYITSTYGSKATCDSSAPSISTIVVKAGANPNGSAITCSNSLSGLAVQDSNGNAICTGAANVSACITSLQHGTPTIAVCTPNAGDKATLTAGVDIKCSTSCDESDGLCSENSYSTVADYLAKGKKGLCLSSSNGGLATLTMKFKASVAQSASCAAKCSDSLSGACGSSGFGANNGATVADYISSLGGVDTCTSKVNLISDTAAFAVDVNDTAKACATSASPVFTATDAAHPATTVNYVAGDGTHQAADFEQFISRKVASVFGANNQPAFAAIAHLSTDSLQGTDVSTEYINLVKTMKSTQISSVSGDYSVALSQISNFIVKSTLNSFSLPDVPATDVVFAVSVMHVGESAWTALDPSLWTWAGQTLSVSPSAKLQIGDQLMYDYHN